MKNKELKEVYKFIQHELDELSKGEQPEFEDGKFKAYYIIEKKLRPIIKQDLD